MVEFLLISLQNLVRKINESIGPGISQIVFTLVLCDLTLENGSLEGENKANEISSLILDILSYVFDNFKIFIAYLNDDFEAILNMLISLSKKSKLEIVYKTIKFEEEIYCLFWNRSCIDPKYQNQPAIVEKIDEIISNTNKLYFSSENIYFQSELTRLLAEEPRGIGGVSTTVIDRGLQASNQQGLRVVTQNPEATPNGLMEYAFGNRVRKALQDYFSGDSGGKSTHR